MKLVTLLKLDNLVYVTSAEVTFLSNIGSSHREKSYTMVKHKRFFQFEGYFDYNSKRFQSMFKML